MPSGLEDALASAFGLSTDSFLKPETRAGSFNDAKDAAAAIEAAMAGDSAVVAADAPAFVRASTFVGARSGYVFKAGALGLGYYLDRTPGATRPGIRSAIDKASDSRNAAGSRNAARGAVPAARRDFRKGFRFAGDSRERAFRAYCTTAHLNGLMNEEEVEVLYASIAEFAEADRGDAMVRKLEEQLRGEEVTVVGATGRTPRGWWGDGTVGRVLPMPQVIAADDY